MSPLTLYFFFKIWLFGGSFKFYVNFSISLSIPTKETVGILTGIALSMLIALGTGAGTLSFPVYEYGMPLIEGFDFFWHCIEIFSVQVCASSLKFIPQ